MKGIEPSRTELVVLLKLWNENNLIFDDRWTLQNWIDREVKHRGFDSVFDAYNRVITNGEKL